MIVENSNVIKNGKKLSLKFVFVRFKQEKERNSQTEGKEVTGANLIKKMHM